MNRKPPIPTIRRVRPHLSSRVAASLASLALAAGVNGAAPTSQPASPSRSRLSVHLLGHYTTGARRVVAAHPRVLKIVDTGGDMLSAARDFKRGTPDGKLVLRIYTPRRYSSQDDPTTAAMDFWKTVLAPPINSLSAADRALIDYVEGPNEGDTTPTWASLADAQWFNRFWVTLAPIIGRAGFRPCAFSISVGNPGGDINQIRRTLDAIVPALRECNRCRGGWSYHSYTIQYTKDVGVELWYSLRYRQFYEYFAQKYPDLATLPLILTEGGVDGQKAPGGPGWKAYDAARYEDWLAWFDGQLMHDPYVVGCTLFASGDTRNWNSFDLEPIAPWLAKHLATVKPAKATPPSSRSVSTESPAPKGPAESGRRDRPR